MTPRCMRVVVPKPVLGEAECGGEIGSRGRLDGDEGTVGCAVGFLDEQSYGVDFGAGVRFGYGEGGHFGDKGGVAYVGCGEQEMEKLYY